MKENKYDEDSFFEQYSKMSRSVNGLEGAGEWHVLQKIFPDFTGKRVLDLGCGFGWHCRYALQQGAQKVTGVDISEKMLTEARYKTDSPAVEYIQAAIEDINFPENSFDVVISSLAFHYISSFKDICRNVHHYLEKGGDFVFSVEHPVFTSYGTQDWYYDENGTRLHWPVDRYFMEGVREASFLGETVVKYHKTLTTYINELLQSGFSIKELVEPEPDEKFLKMNSEMQDELRRPMFLIISAQKN
ncbi:MAG: class I SAM-dependent methyltransferase [Dysgonomonas sp.]|nr:class I SAM-dependent methyltransferase [Dysgonomonas sp.]